MWIGLVDAVLLPKILGRRQGFFNVDFDYFRFWLLFQKSVFKLEKSKSYCIVKDNFSFTPYK